jgi:DNA-binding XRE family transcriptional regulator
MLSSPAPFRQENRFSTAPRSCVCSRACADGNWPLPGACYQTIGYLERGEYSPSLLLTLKVVAVLGAEVGEILSIKPFHKSNWHDREETQSDVRVERDHRPHALAYIAPRVPL